MLRILLSASVLTLALAARSAFGQAPAVAHEELPKPAADAAPADAAPADAAAQPAGDKWRFRWHQGLWWYWLPSEKWVYWADGEWKAYEPASYAEFNRSSPRRRAYSYSNGDPGYWGRWGPVTYDSYGQPQYPYSRRRTGIRQLGPVPAMGGVRSLPGWGGER